MVARKNAVLLLDDAGLTTTLYSGKQMVHEPQLLKQRAREPVIPARVDLSKNTATLYVADVYQGNNIDGIKRGDIKKLLVLEDLPKPANYHGGGTTPIAHGGSWSLKRILGTVPVADDGSAYFEVPPLRSLYLVLLDAKDRSIKQMRSFMTLQPGEQTGGVGCHVARTQLQPYRPGLIALQGGPSRLEPIAGVPEIIDFPRDIQPIRDRNCVRCHGSQKRAGGVVLTGDRGQTYSLAYYNLLLHRQIPVDPYGDFEGWQRPTSRFSRHTIFNPTRPEKSLVLMSPLARTAGGYAEGKPEQVTVKEDRAHAPKAIGHPVIFESAADSDHQKILVHIRAAGQRLDEIKRFDMPGFKPNEQYVREMQRYGLLPAGFDRVKDPIDGYAMDRKYWQSLWWSPETATGDGVTRTSDVIYGRKFGMALTMDVLRPKQPNKAAVVWAVSGGFKSDHGDIAGPEFVKDMSAFLDRGYTVFAVVHGSNPKFDMREVAADMHRAVRFIRHHAGDLGIEAQRVGISGASAGGVISLWLGTQGGAGEPAAADPVDRESSQVQAVACFYPGVDWVHWEQDGSNCLARTRKLGLIDGFRFRDFDPVKKEYVEETDPKKIDEILAEYSPINHVSAKSAPTLILHGDNDEIVRIEQARMMVKQLKEAGVAARLVIKEGRGHSWPGQDQDLQLFADW